jgi:hypothetical protein
MTGWGFLQKQESGRVLYETTDAAFAGMAGS